MSLHRRQQRSYFTSGRIGSYLDAVEQTCASFSAVSLVVFGSATGGGFSDASDIDLVVVLPDTTTPEKVRLLRGEIERLEIRFGFRPAKSNRARGWQARVERAAGYLFPCCVCRRDEFLSGEVARLLDLRTWEVPFVDRIVLASMVASAVTISGEDLVPRIEVPPVRRLDVFRALFAFACRIVLSLAVSPVLADATRYAMGTLKHSVHSCYFCYHHRSATLTEEIAFFNRLFGASRALMELLALRRHYRPSFQFIVRCLPTVVFLHLRTARDFTGRR